MEIRPVGAELFQTDRWTVGQKDERTDMTKLIVAFRNFANAPKKDLYKSVDDLVLVGSKIWMIANSY